MCCSWALQWNVVSTIFGIICLSFLFFLFFPGHIIFSQKGFVLGLWNFAQAPYSQKYKDSTQKKLWEAPLLLRTMLYLAGQRGGISKVVQGFWKNSVGVDGGPSRWSSVHGPRSEEFLSIYLFSFDLRFLFTWFSLQDDTWLSKKITKMVNHQHIFVRFLYQT